VTWQAFVRFRSGSTTRADIAETEEEAREALRDAMGQLKSNGIGTVGPSLVVTKDDLEFIKLELKQRDQ
jgi:CRP-like cAMP-binding protein